MTGTTGLPLTAAVAAAALITASCGTATVPAVADASLGGRYLVDEVTVDGSSERLTGTAMVDIDTQFGELQVDTDCGLLLGSFTLDDDGRAGVTIAGGSSRDCSAAARASVVRLVSGLGRVETWTAPATEADLVPELTLLGPEGRDRVRLIR